MNSLQVLSPQKVQRTLFTLEITSKRVSEEQREMKISERDRQTKSDVESNH